MLQLHLKKDATPCFTLILHRVRHIDVAVAAEVIPPSLQGPVTLQQRAKTHLC